MGWCDDPRTEEREGRDAARHGERYDYDHRERMGNARFDRDSCDAAYARGYESEIERRREERAEEERREYEREQARAEARAVEQYAEYESYPEPISCEHGPVGPCRECCEEAVSS